jgi:hypothetical protein
LRQKRGLANGLIKSGGGIEERETGSRHGRDSVNYEASMFIIQPTVMTIISQIRYNVQTRNILTSALIFDITEALLRPIDP